MTLTIDLTPTEYERVTATARRQGLEPSAFVKKIVTDILPAITHGTGAATQNMTVEEKIQAMDAFAETNRKFPILPDEAFDRSHDEENAPRERDPELVARVKAIRGKYAHTVIGVGTEELHRERQRDREKEEALIRGFQP